MTITVNPLSSHTVNLNDYFDLNAECGYILIYNEKIDVRHSYQSITQQGIAESNSFDHSSNSMRYVFPEYLSDELDWKRIAIHNIDDHAGYVKLRAYKKGKYLRETAINITSHTRMADTLQNLFPYFWEDGIEMIISEGNINHKGINIS